MLMLNTPTQLDMARYFKWMQDPELQYLDPSVGKPSTWLLWAIFAEGTHIGMLSLFNIANKGAEVGIFIGEKTYWGRGYGTESLRRVLPYCFNNLGLKKVYLKVIPDNIRAIRCYEKVGFTRVCEFELEGLRFVRMELDREAAFKDV